MKQIIHTNNAPEALGPYSQAVVFNGLVFTAGQIALNPETNELKDASIETETEQVMQNLKAVLEAAGADFSTVIKTSIFLRTMDDFLVVNEIYGSYFDGGNVPARETVAVQTLPKNVRVEISMIAHVK